MSKRDLALDLFRSYKTGFIKKTKVIEERTSKPGDTGNQLLATRLHLTQPHFHFLKAPYLCNVHQLLGLHN